MDLLKILDDNKEIIEQLVKLGILKDSNSNRNYNIGKSNYAKHIIQPWSIWQEYNLNAWDADIIKRILREKEESGLSKTESRIMDYEKIIHICKERIRQLNNDKISFEDLKKKTYCNISKECLFGYV